MAEQPDGTPRDLGWNRERDGFMIDHATPDGAADLVLRDPTDEDRED